MCKSLGSAATGLVAVVGVAWLLSAPPSVVAQGQSAFTRLAGTWQGDGKISLDDGKSETLKCRAFYTPREAGAGLGLAIRCASASNKIELRANLASNSGEIDGSWEERTFNAAGTVKGKLSANRMSLSITGGSFEGSMNVSISGERHTVSIETKGITLKAVSIDLSRG